MAVLELSFVLRSVFVLYLTFTIDLVVSELSFVSVSFVNVRSYFALAIFFALVETTLVNGFILVLSISSISMDQVIFPFALVNVPVVKN